MKKYSVLIFSLALLLALSGCGKNIFSGVYSPDKPENLSAEQLSSFAQSAALEGDYQKAATYYSQALVKDDKNSEALMGYAQANLNSSSLNIGTMITDLLQQTSGSGAPKYGAPARYNANELPIFKQGYDLRSTKQTAQRVSWALGRIADGAGDGKIKYDDIGVNISKAIYNTIDAIFRIFDVEIDVNGVPTPMIQISGNNEIAMIDTGSIVGPANFQARVNIIKALQKTMVLIVGSDYTPALNISLTGKTISVTPGSNLLTNDNLVDGSVEQVLITWSDLPVADVSVDAKNITSSRGSTLAYLDKIAEKLSNPKITEIVEDIKNAMKSISGDTQHNGEVNEIMNAIANL